MTRSTVELDPLGFDLPGHLIATDPVESQGGRRSDARLLVSWRGDKRLVHTTFAELGSYLWSGDVLVVNTSATLPAALPINDGTLVHLSTERPGGRWIIERRRRCGAGSLPLASGRPGQRLELPEGASVTLVERYPDVDAHPRLWVADLDLPDGVLEYLARAGRPIRYGCPDRSWPLSDYQTVFARHPGSAEMPSAARGFTPELVASLTASGVVVAPLVLHTGLSSQEAGEAPYPERYHVPASTAAVVNAARHRGGRVLAVGTTVTRALESAVDAEGVVHPARGWTELVVTPERGVSAVDGLLSGWHEPRASHLALLEAVAGRPLLERSYRAALTRGYRWHEFGDLHLMLP